MNATSPADSIVSPADSIVSPAEWHLTEKRETIDAVNHWRGGLAQRVYRLDHQDHINHARETRRRKIAQVQPELPLLMEAA